jgi:hypothetical protein
VVESFGPITYDVKCSSGQGLSSTLTNAGTGGADYELIASATLSSTASSYVLGAQTSAISGCPVLTY